MNLLSGRRASVVQNVIGVKPVFNTWFKILFTRVCSEARGCRSKNKPKFMILISFQRHWRSSQCGSKRWFKRLLTRACWETPGCRSKNKPGSMVLLLFQKHWRPNLCGSKGGSKEHDGRPPGAGPKSNPDLWCCCRLTNIGGRAIVVQNVFQNVVQKSLPGGPPDAARIYGSAVVL